VTLHNAVVADKILLESEIARLIEERLDDVQQKLLLAISSIERQIVLGNCLELIPVLPELKGD